MKNDIQALDRIEATRETYDALVEWVNGGTAPTVPPRPIETGVLVFDNEYLVFSRPNRQVACFDWYKHDRMFASFDYDFENGKLMNVWLDKYRVNEGFYRAYYMIAAYQGAMAFIGGHLSRNTAFEVVVNGSQRIYLLQLDVWQSDLVNDGILHGFQITEGVIRRG